jgi:hypothetical protein
MDMVAQATMSQQQVSSLSAVPQSCWHRTTLCRPMAHMQPHKLWAKKEVCRSRGDLVALAEMEESTLARSKGMRTS